jgi:cob(I)alamin adenosyltransferase
LSEKPPYDYARAQPSDKGLVSIFTGNGKGKTTAAIGTAVRAAGNGLKVLIVFFAKGDKHPRGEANVLSQLPNITVTSCQRKGWIDRENIKVEDKELTEAMLTTAREAMLKGDYNLIVLDEINIAVNYGLVSLDEVIGFINDKPNNVELILTGRYAEPELVQMADLVTEMQMVKHPYSKGVTARRGIDY